MDALETIGSWLSWGWKLVLPLGVAGLVTFAYNVRKDRRQRRAARATVHALLRPRFEQLYEHVRNRGTGPNGQYSGLGALATGYLTEITNLLAQHAEKLPAGERDKLLAAVEATRKMTVVSFGVPPDDYKAARDALAASVEVLKS